MWTVTLQVLVKRSVHITGTTCPLLNSCLVFCLFSAQTLKKEEIFLSCKIPSALEFSSTVYQICWIFGVFTRSVSKLICISKAAF